MKDPRTPGGGDAGVQGTNVERPARRPQDTATVTPFDVAAQLGRRRAASWRCPPLDSGLRDPWVDQHPDRWTDAELDSWAAAAVHLRRAGLTPQVPDSVRRSWYARRCSCRGDAA